ncbi:hypothetical protein ACFPVX_04060 [Cohnella faecalis]|nr:hypothetical protein [Cohnella faecalis]
MRLQRPQVKGRTNGSLQGAIDSIPEAAFFCVRCGTIAVSLPAG